MDHCCIHILQLNNLAFASDAGKLFGFVSGIAAVYLPLWIVLLIGSALGFVGYGVQYLFLLNKASSLPYTLVFLLTVLAGNSICWINTVCYVIAIENFPFDRQLAVGLSTSYQGLSAKIYSDLVDMFFKSSSSIQRARSYLLLNCILPLVVCLITSPLIRVMKTQRSRRLSGGFLVIFMVTIFTGTYAVITSLGSRKGLCSPSAILIGMCVFLVAPLVVPLMEKLRERMENKCLIRSHGKRVCDESSMEKENGGVVNEHGVKDEGLFVCEDEEMEAKVMIKRLNFWLYFFVYMFGATVGMVYLNNLGQIVESRGSSKTSSLVSLASSFGFFGRIFPCLLDYHISRVKYKVSRPALIALMMVPMTASFFLLLNNNSLCLYISTATIGICTGAITSISVSTTAELFGTKNFGVNHNIVVSNIPIGSLLFGNMAALLYRKEALANDNEKCMGIKCYQTSFIIWGTLCFIGTFLAIILHSRYKKSSLIA
ncbi:putative MFS transporter superfamily [Helianthus annuus]|nr:putative MFS transporter superfamily [Helianthus annuus]KAJ0626673.1 putative MFS transporter superfamily [Helianthus annuus]KAJ0783020.1 putative MFS transporter superfamily [Helianthus annuus]